MKLTHRVSALLAAIIIVGSLGNQWSVDAQSGQSDNGSTPVPAEFDGLIKASRTINLSAPVDGLLESVRIERGDTVSKGQIVATLESTVETATWELAEARARMEAEQRSRRAQLAFLTGKLGREERLHTRGIVSDDELALSRTEHAVGQEAVLEADERKQLAVLEQKRAAAALALRTVYSPIDGVVIERVLSKGELVTRQHQSKIMVLAQIDPLTVEVIVPADIFGTVSVGEQADVVPVGFAQYRSTATVKTVDKVIDAASHSFRVSLELPNPNHRLPAGVKCSVRFNK